MIQVTQYFGRFGQVRRSVMLPPWAKAILMLLATPGLALAILAGLAFMVALVVLAIMVLPAWLVLYNLTGVKGPPEGPPTVEPPAESSGRKNVSSTIIE